MKSTRRQILEENTSEKQSVFTVWKSGADQLFVIWLQESYGKIKGKHMILINLEKYKR